MLDSFFFFEREGREREIWYLFIFLLKEGKSVARWHIDVADSADAAVAVVDVKPYSNGCYRWKSCFKVIWLFGMIIHCLIFFSQFIFFSCPFLFTQSFYSVNGCTFFDIRRPDYSFFYL